MYTDFEIVQEKLTKIFMKNIYTYLSAKKNLTSEIFLTSHFSETLLVMTV